MYIHIYIYIYIFIHIYIYIYTHVCTFIYTCNLIDINVVAPWSLYTHIKCTYTHLRLYTYIHVHMYVCTWVISLTCSRRRAGVRIHILSVCTLISTYIYMQVKLLTPIWRRSGVIRSICTFMYTHIYIYTYVYVYIYINI